MAPPWYPSWYLFHGIPMETGNGAQKCDVNGPYQGEHIKKMLWLFQSNQASRGTPILYHLYYRRNFLLCSLAPPNIMLKTPTIWVVFPLIWPFGFYTVFVFCCIIRLHKQVIIESLLIVPLGVRSTEEACASLMHSISRDWHVAQDTALCVMGACEKRMAYRHTQTHTWLNPSPSVDLGGYLRKNNQDVNVFNQLGVSFWGPHILAIMQQLFIIRRWRLWFSMSLWGRALRWQPLEDQ